MTPITNTAKPRLADKARLKWDPVREKHLLLFPEGVLVLNPTAQAVLELCDGERTVAKIVEVLSERYKSDDIAPGVKEIFQRLAEKNLVKMVE
jgi:pyrroloquinoline quinone biosynthesis protein D